MQGSDAKTTLKNNKQQWQNEDEKRHTLGRAGEPGLCGFRK